ncbi:GIY-YIG nuclease family protein [Propionivibrio soli]|uniref:GIY-YIG nuclease family protein n=1 Tax=Propionivibrio soli TaxID=2976531 RepID=UPI0021E85102|nr:GIY-YIG nuclease family protein [Propionivibrio soli]
MARPRPSEPSGAQTRSAATDPVSPRTYQLLIEVAVPVTVRVGCFGTFEFPAGQYVYTGSAMRNLEARVKRHLATEKRLRWHIDFLLAAPGVRICEVRRFVEAECTVNERTKGEVVVAGFGASDCRHRCGSHLKRVR